MMASTPPSDTAELTRRLNFSFVLPGRLAGLAWPFGRATPPGSVSALLQSSGVAMLVNLTGECYPAAARAALGPLRLLDLPIEDYAPPSLEQVDDLWRLYMQMPAGAAMAVHCAAGIGRTGTLLACLLGRERGLDGDGAIRQIRLLRPGSVETAEQEALVREWLRLAAPGS